MENYHLLARLLAIVYSFIHWFQFTNGQDTNTQDGLNFGTPLPTLTPQDLPLPAIPYNKCNIM